MSNNNLSFAKFPLELKKWRSILVVTCAVMGSGALSSADVNAAQPTSTPGSAAAAPTLPAWVIAETSTVCPGGKLIGPLYGDPSNPYLPFISQSQAADLARYNHKIERPTPLAKPGATRGQVFCYLGRNNSIPGFVPGTPVVVRVTKRGHTPWTPSVFHCRVDSIMNFSMDQTLHCADGSKAIDGPAGYAGLRVAPVDDNSRSTLNYDKADGALVVAVADNSPANKAGLAPGDIIESIDGTAIKVPADIRLAVRSRVIGESMALTVWRGGTETSVSVQIAAAPPPTHGGI